MTLEKSREKVKDHQYRDLTPTLILKGDEGGIRMMWGTDYGAGGWAMMIGTFVVAVMVIAVAVMGAIWLTRTPRAVEPAGDAQSAESILDARYARGEINDAELTQRRQILVKNSASTGTKR